MVSALLQQESPAPSRFARSQSAVQEVRFPPQDEKGNQPNHRKQNWFQYRFGKEHGFGSAVLLANTLSTSLQIRAGHKEGDISRLIGGTLATALNMWVFLSSRGGKAPQGQNAAERVMDTLRHPSQSSVHFAMLCSIVINAIFTSGHLYKGIQGDSGEHTRRLTAGMSFLSVAMITSGIFQNYKDKREPADKPLQVKPVQFAQSKSQQASGTSRIKEVFQHAWQTDKRGLLGRCVLIGCQLADLREGLAKRSFEGKASSTLLTSACIDLCVQLGQSYYLYERLARDNPQTDASHTKEQKPIAIRR